jgi:hypothetical protein
LAETLVEDSAQRNLVDSIAAGLDKLRDALILACAALHGERGFVYPSTRASCYCYAAEPRLAGFGPTNADDEHSVSKSKPSDYHGLQARFASER